MRCRSARSRLRGSSSCASPRDRLPKPHYDSSAAAYTEGGLAARVHEHGQVLAEHHAPKAPGCAPGSPRTWRPRWGLPVASEPESPAAPASTPGQDSRPEPHWGPVRGTGAHLWPVGRVLRRHRWCRLLPAGTGGTAGPAVTGPGGAGHLGWAGPGCPAAAGRWAQSRRAPRPPGRARSPSSPGMARRRVAGEQPRCARRAAERLDGGLPVDHRGHDVAVLRTVTAGGTTTQSRR